MTWMRIKWSFQPYDAQMFHPGVQDIPEKYVTQALALGAVFCPPSLTAEKILPVEKTVVEASVPSPSVKPKRTQKPSASHAGYMAQRAEARKLGYQGSLTRDALNEFFAQRETQTDEQEA